MTSFIGRDDDLARIDTLLAAGRLVTVLGPGGAGKTRLAVEAARRHRHEYRDGAWMVDLTSIIEPAKVGAALLARIGLRGGAVFEGRTRVEGDELDVLVDQLGGRESLLLVDNCEHLIDAVAHLVAALLSRCAGLRVLATGREPLAVDGEALVPLGPLALPGPDDGVQQASAWGAELFRLTDLVIPVAQTRQPCLVTRVSGEELSSACSGGSSACDGSACFAAANDVLGVLRLAAFRVRRGDSDTRCVTFY
ncbi:hypothetical protein O3Q52_33885 [Streptomyces sp. ActVer]|uniref:hypothetical protein n=1 Tax=Streptomyces sp. ActVer TaxID=3014558 RepID=UPI0022B314EB|nr:hypothetical protein [Streptomyces sp. ActVer]MCZ4513060.1 hypothetical protein [Streptomyces sp. ActVer]